MALRDEFAAERAERIGAMQLSRDLSAKLHAMTDELSRREQQVTAKHQEAVEAQHSAAFSVGQMSEAVQRTLLLWQRGHEHEVSELRRDVEAAKLGDATGVSSSEADRSLLLVASLWHAAGRSSPVEQTPVAQARCVDEVLNAWRLYFHRDAWAEPPLLKPTSSIIAQPLQAVAGARAGEVLTKPCGQPPATAPQVPLNSCTPMAGFVTPNPL